MPLVMIKSDPRARLKPCLRCGYSLRNVPDARVCPECGLPVWLTLSGNDDLDMSNPAWLTRLAQGSMVLSAAHLVLLLGVAAMHAWRMAVDHAGDAFEDTARLMPFVGGAYLAICGVGLILLSAGENRLPERARGWRIATLVSGAITLVAGVWFATPIWTFHTPTFIVVLIATGQAIVCWTYLARLARRIPNRRLEQFAKFFSYAVALALASAVLRGSHSVMWMIFSPWSKFVIAWTLLLLVYPPLAIAMYLRLTRAFHSASKAATKNWETPG